METLKHENFQFKYPLGHLEILRKMKNHKFLLSLAFTCLLGGYNLHLVTDAVLV